MQLLFTHRSDTSSSHPLLLFFSGWGQSPATVGDIEFQSYDTAVVWDYRTPIFSSADGTDITDDIISRLSTYSEIVIAAWSFGVHAAARFMASHPDLPVTARIAFSGSRFTVDAHRGIDPAIFNATLGNLSERSVERFEMRVWGGAAAFRRGGSRLSGRPVSELREELQAFDTAPAPRMLWDTVFVPTSDLIISPEAQIKAWEGDTVQLITFDAPHRPDFNLLLRRVLTDKSRVSDRFSRARSTYDHNASHQLSAGRRLLSLARDFIAESPAEMLEIGCGTGRLSSEAIALFQPRRATLWDLEIPASAKCLAGTFPETEFTFIETDAETAVSSLPAESVDLIFSASTVQWFNSLRHFLAEAYRALRPGGHIVISTYGPLTMRQISSITGEPSRFLSVESVRRAIPPHAETLLLEEETDDVSFPSPLEVLRHVSLTGVNALSSGNDTGARDARELLRSYPLAPDGSATLTFNPVYLIIKKP